MYVEGGQRTCNVWSIKIRTTHNLSLWLYEYFWIILSYGHLVYFILKVLAWEICNMRWGFAKKVIIKSQRHLCMVRIFMNQTLIIVMIIKEGKGSYIPNNLDCVIIWIPGMAPTLTKALIMICASAKDHSWWLHTSLALVLQAKPWECLSIYAENPVIKKN